MSPDIVRLYPPDGETLQHQGLYLSHHLRSKPDSANSSFVYANFIASLDGRIAVPDPDGSGVTLATQITNRRDWRLFQELAVQSDALITSGRYLREYQQGPKQELLQVYDDPEFKDLGRWRQEHGLRDYPAVAVISRSLDFEVPAPLREAGRKLYIFTTEEADEARKRALAEEGAEVIEAGESDVTGPKLIAGLRDFGHRVVYSTAGPKIFHLLLAGGVLDRLYLTIAHRILGGAPYASIMEGSLLEVPADLKIVSLFFDSEAPEGAGQFYAAFDRVSGV